MKSLHTIYIQVFCSVVYLFFAASASKDYSSFHDLNRIIIEQNSSSNIPIIEGYSETLEGQEFGYHLKRTYEEGNSKIAHKKKSFYASVGHHAIETVKLQLDC